MFLSLNWLKDYVDLPKALTAEELGRKLTLHTVEIDGVENQAEKYGNVVVGKILELSAHPNAERLQIVRVDAGVQELKIVCGAANIEVGQMVPVALVGAVLPNGLEIKQTEIRGEMSSGMLCAEDELGLGEDRSGIMILDKKAKAGQPLSEHLHFDDVLFEVDNKSITNRPDLWGHAGMAREINCFLNLRPTEKFLALSSERMDGIVPENENIRLEVKVEDFELCPRYCALAMDNISIAPSPSWLSERLIAVGVRPINNIVDATNYVMFELGQPLHAFDFQNVAADKPAEGGEARIIVRRAKTGEMITTLDGKERALDPDMLLIANDKRPLAVAGVMGGEQSGISDNTQAIILESANFNFISIRKTSGRLGLRTEASMRYEKSLDPNLCETALLRVAALIKEFCPSARIASRPADVKQFTLDQGPLLIEAEWLRNIIGHAITDSRIVEILSGLGFGVTDTGAEKTVFQIGIPSWRATKDISLREDIAEEIARIYGYDDLDANMPLFESKAPEANELRRFERRIKDVLAQSAAGSEVSNYSFVGEDQLKRLGVDYSRHIRLSNPISNTQTMLRQSLAPNMIATLAANQARQNSFLFFEVGSVFIGYEGGISKDNLSDSKLPYQEKRLGLGVLASDQKEAYQAVKTAIASLLSYFNLEAEYAAMDADLGWVEEDLATRVSAAGESLGMILPVALKMRSKIGLKKSAVIAELSLPKFFGLAQRFAAVAYREFDKYPRLTRDLAFVINERTPYSDVRKEILDFHGFIREADLFDVYQGGKLGEGNKSLAFHIVYQTDKTLTGSEVDEIQAGLIKRLEERFEARVRDF